MKMRELQLRQLFYLFVVNGLNVTAPLMIAPILIARGGPEIYGTFALVGAIYGLCTLITDLGCANYSLKRLAKSEETLINDLIMCVRIRGFASFIVIVTLYAVSHAVILEASSKVLTATSISIMLFSFSLNVNHLYIFYQSVSRLAIIQLFSRFLLVSGIYFFGETKEDVINCCATATILFNVIGFLALLPKVRQKKRSHRKTATKNSTYFYARAALPFGLVRYISASYNNTPMIIVAAVSNEAMLGIYAIAENIYRVGQTFLGTIAQHVYPHILREKTISVPLSLTYYLTLVNLILFAVLLIFGEAVVSNIFGEEALPALVFIYPFFLIYVFLTVSSMIGMPVFHAISKAKALNITVVYGALTYLMCLSITAPLWLRGSLMPVIASLLFAEFIVLAVRILFLRRMLWHG